MKPINQTDAQGLKQGEWEELIPHRGQPRRHRGHYKAGKRVGKWQELHSWTDLLWAEGEYVEGKKEGIWHEWSYGELSAKGPYKNDQKEGVWEIYYLDKTPDDTPKLWKKGAYKRGTPHGVWWEQDQGKTWLMRLKADGKVEREHDLGVLGEMLPDLFGEATYEFYERLLRGSTF